MMYLHAIEELEKGNLYHSKDVLAKIVADYPNYKPAQTTYQKLNEQEQALKNI